MYSAGLLWCPSCYRLTEFVCEVMPRPGHYPACECVVCQYEFAEGVVDDDTRAEAITKMREERLRMYPGRRR